MANTLTFPTVGSTVTLRTHGPAKVSGPCADPLGGRWYCVTHQEAFLNQFEKDSHIHRGRHELVWVCFAHGPETDPNWSKA